MTRYRVLALVALALTIAFGGITASHGWAQTAPRAVAHGVGQSAAAPAAAASPATAPAA